MPLYQKEWLNDSQRMPITEVDIGRATGAFKHH